MLAGTILLCPPALAQTAYDQARAKGDSLRHAGNLPGAIAAYAGALPAATPDQLAGTNGLLYTLASTHALHGAEPDSAFHYLEQAFGSVDPSHLLHDPDLYFLLKDARWLAVEDRALDAVGREVGPGTRKPL